MTKKLSSSPRGKPWIMEINAYVPGKATSHDGKKLIKLSANENPLGTSQSVQLARKIPSNAAEYPDPDSSELRNKIGQIYGLNPDKIICGTGSDELLNLVAQGFAGPGDEVLFSRYSFSVYEIASKRCGATPIEAPDRDYATDVDSLLSMVTSKTRVVFVANPNNPTGTWLGRKELERLHSLLPSEVLLVIDQAYGEYLEDDENDGGLELAANYTNVLVTRTFSKIYGLAGERIGWATGSDHLIDVLNRIRGPFNVTTSGQLASLAALQDQEFVVRSRKHNAEELKLFSARIASLSNYGVRAIPSRANFLLVLFEGKVTAFMALKVLEKAGYGVRHLPNQGLGNGLRITIGQRRDMEKIAMILRDLMEQST